LVDYHQEELQIAHQQIAQLKVINANLARQISLRNEIEIMGVGQGLPVPIFIYLCNFFV